MPAHEPSAALAGAHVLVTRPEHQAAGLCERIAAAGGRASRLPVIEITGPADPAAVDARLARVSGFDIAIFVSPNAVERTLARLTRGWPGGPRVAAVGQGSAAMLARHGIAVDICPRTRFDSEGLLDEPALQAVGGLRLLILRGNGGRDLLASTLRARGAQVEFAEVYRRAIPAGAEATLQRIAADTPPVDAIVVTSNEGLRNLDRIAGERLHDWLRARQLVVISTRAAELARELGFTRMARVASEASDAGLFAALQQWRGEAAATGGTDRGAGHVH